MPHSAGSADKPKAIDTTAAAHPAGRLSRLVPLFGALAVLLALSAGIVQLYPPIGWVDPGLYIHWFISPAENMIFRGGNYHAARLPFVLPGAALYALTDMVTAQAALVASFCLLGFGAVYTMAAGALRSVPARLAVALFFSFNPLWLAAFLRGYVDGPAIAFGLLGVGLLLHGDGPLRRARLASSGAMVMLGLAVHPFAGGISALSTALVLSLRCASLRGLLSAGGIMLLGAAGTFCVLASVGKLLGMPFLFFGMSSAGVVRAFSSRTADFAVPLSAWIQTAPRVLLLPMALAMVLAGLRMTPRGARNREGWLLAGAALVPLAVYLGLQPLGGLRLPFAGFILLQYPFYASYLFLSLVPAVVLLLRGLERRGYPMTWSASLGVAVFLLVLLVIAQHITLAQREHWFSPAVVWGAVGTCALISLVGLVWRPNRATVLGALGTVALVGVLNRDTVNVFKLADGADYAAQHRSLAALHELLARTGASKGNYLIWFARERFTSRQKLAPDSLYALNFSGQTLRLNMLDSLAASLGWDRVALGFDMPTIGPASTPLFASLSTPPRPLVTLCAEMAECEAGFAELEAAGVTVLRGQHLSVNERGSAPFTAALAEISVEETAAPSSALVKTTVARLVDRGPNGAALKQAGVTVTGVQDLACTDDRATTRCTFKFTLSTGEQAAQTLQFVRLGRLWRLKP